MLGVCSGVVMGGGLKDLTKPTRRPTNKATIHVLSPVMENVSSPTLKTEQGANLQRQQTGRGPCRCGLGSARCDTQSDFHTGERNQASASQRAEQGENGRPERIPPWAGGSYGPGGQGDLVWMCSL